MTPVDKIVFRIGSPHPSLAQVLEGLEVLAHIQTSVLLMFHGGAADGCLYWSHPRCSWIHAKLIWFLQMTGSQGTNAEERGRYCGSRFPQWKHLFPHHVQFQTCSFFQIPNVPGWSAFSVSTYSLSKTSVILPTSSRIVWKCHHITLSLSFFLWNVGWPREHLTTFSQGLQWGQSRQVLAGSWLCSSGFWTCYSRSWQLMFRVSTTEIHLPHPPSQWHFWAWIWNGKWSVKKMGKELQ